MGAAAAVLHTCPTLGGLCDTGLALQCIHIACDMPNLQTVCFQSLQSQRSLLLPVFAVRMQP